jgi:hypothetical protein
MAGFALANFSLRFTSSDGFMRDYPSDFSNESRKIKGG